jgi:phage tail-like protein
MTFAMSGLNAAGLTSAADILGLSNRFGVTIDGTNLGKWGKCHGLAVDFKPEMLNQGGVYDTQTILPGQMSYTPITLERAVSATETAKVQAWLSKMVHSWVYSANSGSGGTAVITLYSPTADPVVSWTLRSVFPSKWEGPKMDAGTSGIALESLTLVHEGFL